jgi:uncharacterized protein YjbI with pentapeptide repeats
MTYHSSDSQDKNQTALEILTKYAQGQRNFQGIFAKNINLYRAQLTFIVLEEAELQKANLKEVNFAGANLNHADLSSANLTGSNLIGADLIRTKLASANLSKALLSGANLSAANLRYANLSGVSLVGANLSAADLTGAKLDGANLEGANLQGVDLRQTDLDQLDLENVDLENTLLSNQQIIKLREAGIFIETFEEEPFGNRENPIANPFSNSPELSPFSNPPELSPFSNSNLEEYPPLPSLSEGFEMMEIEMEATEESENESLYSENYPIIESTEESYQVPFSSEENPIIESSIPLMSLEDVQYDQDINLDAIADEPETFIERFGSEKTLDFVEEEEDDDDMPSDELVHDTIHNISKQEVAEKINSPLIQSIQGVLKRRTKYNFQSNVLEAYEYQCAITGCTIRPLLVAVQINPNEDLASDHPSNGIVLRTDISDLFKLHLIAIDPKKLTVLIAPSLRNSEYIDFATRKILFPDDPAKRPNKEFLKAHLEECPWYGEDSEIITQNSQQTLSQSESIFKGTLSGLSDAFKQTFSGQPESIVQPVIQPGQNANITSTSHQSKKLPLGLIIAVVSVIIVIFGGISLLRKPSEINLANIPTATGKIETMTVEIDQVIYTNRGIINNNTSYIPLKLIDELAINQNQINQNDLIVYQDQAYIKAAALKGLNVQLGWNAETRTLSLKKGS